MATPIEVLVPDIGGFKDVSVIEVLVKDGQQIDKESPLITLETEKATMDVPAPAAGRVAQVKLKRGDKVSEGSLILMLEAESGAKPDGAAPKAASPPAAPAAASTAPAPAPAPQAAAPAAPAAAAPPPPPPPARPSPPPPPRPPPPPAPAAPAAPGAPTAAAPSAPAAPRASADI